MPRMLQPIAPTTDRLPSVAWSIPCVVLVAFALTACGPSPADQARSGRLAQVKKVALVSFVGKSKFNPASTGHKPLIDAMYAVFSERAAADTQTVQLIPVEQVVGNPAYREVAKSGLPSGVLSPIGGLTYVRNGVVKGETFSVEPITRALSVDALLMIVVEFDVEIKENGTAPYLVANVQRGLLVPPEDEVSGDTTLRFEEAIPATIVSHPKLMASIGAKWIILTPPNAAEKEELIGIAVANKTTLPSRLGRTLVDDLVSRARAARGLRAN